MTQKYKFTEEMDEISGMRGGYEQTCRDMVIAGVEWLDENPNADLSYKEFKDVYGTTKDIEKLQDVMHKASGDDCTGAMMQACLSHVRFIKNTGWEEYVKKMEGTRIMNKKAFGLAINATKQHIPK